MSRARQISSVVVVTAALVVAVPRGVAADQSRGAALSNAPSNSFAEASEPLQEVTVTAKRAKLAPRVRTFVKQIALLENGGNDAGLARWGAPPVCPLVSGLTREEGESILERVSDIARRAGVPLAGEHCSPNLYILLTSQPEDLLRGMEKRNRAFTFGYDESSHPHSETPENVVDEFINTPRAVRVWYNSAEKDPWGQPIAYCPAVDLGLVDLGTYVRCDRGAAGGSHLTLSAITTFSRVFVIVDQRRLRRATFGQLADYVAMVGFAKLKPDSHLGDAPTILTLFNGATRAAPAGMTDWDRAFLKSLYATDQESKTQQGQIARAMVREITH